MTFEQALNESGGNMKGVKSTHWNSREDKNYYKHKHYWKENDSSFKAGRERLVSAIQNMITGEGKYIDRGTIRKYIDEVFSKKEEDRPDWIQDAISAARSNGFDPESESDQKNVKDDSDNDKEEDDAYEARKAYFSRLMYGFKAHFTDGKKSKKSSKEKEDDKDN